MTIDIPAKEYDRGLLAFVLMTLSVVFALWFRGDRHYFVALVFFALPPILLGLGALRGSALARFWSGVLALLWFSHGVMVAWSNAAQRSWALAEVALAVAIVLLSCAGGLRAKFAKHKTKR